MKYKLLAIVAFLLVLTTNVLADDEYHAMVDGKKVTLQNVGSGGTVVIGVSDGTGVDVLETIPASTTETVMGLEITNVETFYEDLKSGRSAILKIEGQTETKEVKLKVIVTSSTEARNKYFLKVDDSITVNGKIVKLLNVGSGGSIVISVNEIIEEIPATATETVNGIEITNIETNYEDTKAERSAVIGVEGEVIPIAVRESITKAPSWKFSVSCEKERNLDLAMYPAPFLVNGQLNNVKIVVGDNAPASDTVAAIDIAAKLQYYAKTSTAGVPIVIDINPVLASEIINPKNYNLILVGRPSNNHLILEHTAEAPAGVGNIRLGQNGDNVALIVTGSIDVEVRWAAKVLSNYEDYKLFGNKCIVKAIDEGEVTYVPKKPEIKEPEKPEYGCIKNRICEPEYGENVANCPSDCKEISTPLQCNGCMSDGNCLDFGMRIVEGNIAKYCDLNKQFIPQKSANAACQNNFECDSNVCAASKCISEGFLKKIMNWFAKMFGYVVKG